MTTPGRNPDLAFSFAALDVALGAAGIVLMIGLVTLGVRMARHRYGELQSSCFQL